MTGCPGEVLQESIGRHCQDWDGGFSKLYGEWLETNEF